MIDLPVNSALCHCSSCTRVFLGAASFDIHRGINTTPRREDSQDLGRCLDSREMTLAGLAYDDEFEKWGTPREWALSDKMRQIRQSVLRK